MENLIADLFQSKVKQLVSSRLLKPVNLRPQWTPTWKQDNC